MFTIEGLVGTVVFMLVAALILGLLWWLITYVESQGLGPPIIFKVIRIVFIIMIVLVCIAVLMSLIGHPIVRWDRRL